jgi:hypothetical protein
VGNDVTVTEETTSVTSSGVDTDVTESADTTTVEIAGANQIVLNQQATEVTVGYTTTTVEIDSESTEIVIMPPLYSVAVGDDNYFTNAEKTKLSRCKGIDIYYFDDDQSQQMGASIPIESDAAYYRPTVYTKSGIARRHLDVSLDLVYSNVISTNNVTLSINIIAPDPDSETVVNFGSVLSVGSSHTTYLQDITVSGDVTKYISDYSGISKTADNTSTPSLGSIRASHYNPNTDRTTLTINKTASGSVPISILVGDNIYSHPFDWATQGATISPAGDTVQLDGTTDAIVKQRRDFQQYLGYFSSIVEIKFLLFEQGTQDNAHIDNIKGKITDIID